MKLKKANGQQRVDEDELLSSISTSCALPLEPERLRDILDNIPSAVMVVEKLGGILTFVNKRALELYGRNPCGLKLEEHFEALKFYTLDGKVCPTEQLCTYRALYNEETVLNSPEIIERPDGKRFIFNVSAKPLYDNEGKVNAAVTIFDDVTERVKTQEALQESEDRLKMAQRIAHVGGLGVLLKVRQGDLV